eukprot:COSAG01_NODE_3664_length_5814_cov_15.571829_7_plen_132_part_00
MPHVVNESGGTVSEIVPQELGSVPMSWLATAMMPGSDRGAQAVALDQVFTSNASHARVSQASVDCATREHIAPVPRVATLSVSDTAFVFTMRNISASLLGAVRASRSTSEPLLSLACSRGSETSTCSLDAW